MTGLDRSQAKTGLPLRICRVCETHVHEEQYQAIILQLRLIKEGGYRSVVIVLTIEGFRIKSHHTGRGRDF